jgi:peptidoglycan/xylan/chitin deacetylase (PgdA/CDA1 family)
VRIKLLLCLALLSIITLCGCRAGADTETAAELPPVTIPQGARLVSLFFDDAFLNQYDVAIPVLKEHGFRATFGVITGSIGTGRDLWEYMDKKHIIDLAAQGMDIASHTVTHANLTANLTDEKLRREVFDSKKELEKMGFKVNTMVYPYYEWNDRAIACVKEAGYTCARAGWSNEKAHHLSAADMKSRYHVFSWQITNQDLETFKNYLKEADSDTVAGLTYHFIADDGPAATSTPAANFKAQMAYLKEGGFTVVPLPQLIKR